MNNRKIQDIEKLAILIAKERERGRSIVHCHGVFDLLHIGHIRYFDQAKAMGDVLVVTITEDRFVDKGPGRPAFNEKLRAEAVASLDSVDYVAINRWPTAEQTLRLIRPNIYVKGSDFTSAESDPTGKLVDEERVVQEIGARLAFTEDVVFSSTNLINRFLSSHPEKVQQYLNVFKSRYSLQDVRSLLDRFAALKILVIGDTILDDYHFCHTLGLSSKDPALALHYESSDLFAGGVLAIANHLASFSDQIDLVSVLGEMDSHEEFIRSKLKPHIKFRFIKKKNCPTTIKRRFIEGYSLNKLFEVYVMDDSCLNREDEEVLCNSLRATLGDYDLVVVADFGHGAIGPMTRGVLTEYGRFVAVNTQANAGNRGFHTISRYPRCQFVSLAKNEIQLDFRDLDGDVKPMMGALMARIEAEYVAVTLGKQGCMILHKDGSLVEVPALVQKVVDRVGSGDAFFSVTAMAASLGASPELLGLLGNVAGGLAVEILGNQKSITRMDVQKFATALMK